MQERYSESPVYFDTVASAFTCIRAMYDPDGDGEEKGSYMTLMKVKSHAPG